ncbi:MAG: ABC transporter substrate-binding protein [Oligoflexia bacterium]|nr:ABC transporter substrate-binding protein [Oligoflexia bacterium]
MKKIISICFLSLITGPGHLSAEATLPDDIKWETNNDDPVFASPKAKQGGVYHTYVYSYPMTFRRYGPDANSGWFAVWQDISCLWGLISIHPDTLKPVPELATHWAVMDDNKTLYFKLDPDVKWRDGKPVTADDYLFAFEMAKSDYIKDPITNNYARERFESIEKIDDYTIKVVGKYPSWRALYEFGSVLGPEPMHATGLDDNWVKRTNWDIPLCVGPYYISDFQRGKNIRLAKVKNWWGNDKKYLKNRFNFDSINIKIINDTDIAFEYFKKKQLDIYSIIEPDKWHNQTDFDEVKNGTVIKRKVFYNAPRFKFGIFFSVKDPVTGNKNFRKALQHLLDFNKINENLFYGEYFRLRSFFQGTEYAKKDLKSYPYDPGKAGEYLKKAGWVKRGNDGILLNEKGERCSFTVSHGHQNHNQYLNIYKEDLKKAGVEMKLRLLDGAKFLSDVTNKLFQAALLLYGGVFYPDPEEFFHSKYADTKNNNNLFSYANKEVDELLEIYKMDLDFDKRLKAMHKLDDIIKDEAMYLPFWYMPFYKVLYYNNLTAPQKFEPKFILKASIPYNHYTTWWFESDEPVTDGTFKDINKVTDFDPYGVLKDE